MPFFPTRSAPKPLPISLVKPAEKLQPENPVPALSYPGRNIPVSKMNFRAQNGGRLPYIITSISKYPCYTPQSFCQMRRNLLSQYSQASSFSISACLHNP